MYFDWNDEATSELRRLFDLGYSSSQIGADLGGTFGRQPSRNSVIGKLHRLGLRRGYPAPRTTPRPPRVQRKGVHRAKAWKSRAPAPAPEPYHEPAPPTDEDTPMEQRRTLLELDNEHCRWPIGDPGTPGFFFCGSPTADMANRQPYCPFHARWAMAPRTSTRRPFIPMRNSA